MENFQSMDLFLDVSDTDILKNLLAELHDDLSGRLSRFRFLIDIGATLGSQGTMIYGGHASALAYGEARSSFVTGNFLATVMLCQSLVEHLLAAFLHAALLHTVPPKVQFRDTVKKCQELGLLTDRDATDLTRLSELRNPLTHFRHFDDTNQLDRRGADAKEPVITLLERDAHFAMALAVRILAKAPFRLD
jgi:hypothetical protein